jgi:hypothetical protein
VILTSAATAFLVWILALNSSVTLGGWIFVFPAAAAMLSVARLMRARPAYTNWLQGHERSWQR